MNLSAFFASLLTEEPVFEAPEPMDRLDLSLEARGALETETIDQPTWSRPTSLEQVVSLGRSRYGLSPTGNAPTATFAPPPVRMWGSPLALVR